MNEFPTRSLKIANIHADLEMQSRGTVDPDTVSEYKADMLCGVHFPPVTVYEVNGKYILVDGYHRFIAARDADFTEILCEIRIGSRQDCIRHACASNIGFGLKRTRAHKRHAVLMALNNLQDMSTSQIADLCKVSRPLVEEVREQHAELHAVADQKRVGKDGKSYAVK